MYWPTTATASVQTFPGPPPNTTLRATCRGSRDGRLSNARSSHDTLNPTTCNDLPRCHPRRRSRPKFGPLAPPVPAHAGFAVGPGAATVHDLHMVLASSDERLVVGVLRRAGRPHRAVAAGGRPVVAVRGRGTGRLDAGRRAPASEREGAPAHAGRARPRGERCLDGHVPRRPVRSGPGGADRRPARPVLRALPDRRHLRRRRRDRRAGRASWRCEPQGATRRDRRARSVHEP